MDLSRSNIQVLLPQIHILFGVKNGLNFVNRKDDFMTATVSETAVVQALTS